jgi:hypothetical protein
MNTSLSASKAGFHLLYHDDERTRVCFYVNKRLDLDSWAVEFNGGDFATIHHQTYQGLIHVHNIYNSPPSSHTSNEPGTLPVLDRALRKPGQHIAVGEYNLHHPMWGGPGAYTQHNAADLLISIIAEHALQQMVPPDSTTWAARGTTSMLDLALLTPEVAGRVIRCAIEPKLDHDSDHIPIATVVDMGIRESPPLERRLWKRLKEEDNEAIRYTVESRIGCLQRPIVTRNDTKIYRTVRTMGNLSE